MPQTRVLTRRATIRTLLPLIGAAWVAFSSPAQASPLPAPGDFAAVPERTALSYVNTVTGVRVGTANENEARPGLSTVKLYLADYVVRRADVSPDDLERAARMIRASDDWAASELDNEYPEAIDTTAADYGLTATVRGDFWGNSTTSTADTVRFLEAKTRTDPSSPILEWMITSDPVATDGTVQGWGTGQLAGVTGSKWGWADDRSTVVASASIGDEFIVASNTYGSDEVQTDDVLSALGGFDLTPRAPKPPEFPTVMDVLSRFSPS